MVRSCFAAGICLALAGLLNAAEPSVHAGRASIESLLQTPAELDFGHRQKITVKELFDEIHRKDHISIRFDAPLMEAMSNGVHAEPPATAMTAYGCGVASSSCSPCGAYTAAPACSTMPACSTTGPCYSAPGCATTGATAASCASLPPVYAAYCEPPPPPPAASSCAPPLPALPGVDLAAAIAKVTGAAATCDECDHCCQTTNNAVAGNPTCPAKCECSSQKLASAASHAAGAGKYPPTPPSVPPPPHAVVQINVTAPQVIPNGEAGKPSPVMPVEPPHGVAPELFNTEIYIQTIDMHNVSIATALQIALDALGDGDLGIESSGLPIAVSNAEKLDYVVENDGILITSRMKALTYKETRVYNVKHMKDLKSEQLAAVIKQSVRPWSWRSRIDDLGEQLRTGGPRIPAKAVTALFKSGVQLASAESPLGELAAAAEATATDAPADKPATTTATTPKPTTTPSAVPAAASDSDSLTAQEAAQLGDAIVNGLVTFVQASITTVEIMHYADPPTGTIQTVPGKLIITQSQAAHREIAELLKELSEE